MTGTPQPSMPENNAREPGLASGEAAAKRGRLGPA